MCSTTKTMTNKRRRSGSRKSRRTKSKAKKPKFLSLRHQFPANEIKNDAAAAAPHSRQLNLFPLHPENNQVEERECQDHENVALFFSAADGAASSLTGLLDSSSAAADSNSSHTDHNSSRVEYLSRHEESAALVRTAMRNRVRDSSEEKWVCYSEVVERKVKVKEEEVSSSAVDRRPIGVSLKLDYEEIMKAWTNKGPLYIEAETSQIVPDVNHDFLDSNNGMRWESCNVGGGLWTVPEMNNNMMNMGQREASVLRYKEKRQNRLFCKKIRYQVRKLNAEKRPRLKGRFVKRS